MTPEELWKLPIDQFNSYRQENDLPKLILHFEKILPEFTVWLETFKISKDQIIKSSNPGSYFHGDGTKYLLDSGKGIEFFFEPKHIRSTDKRLKKKNTEHLKFTPYIGWAKEKFGQDFIKFPTSSFNTLRYNFGYAPDSSELCQWNLIGFQVLKLGGVTIGQSRLTQGMNLDFANLDFLTIEGDYHGNSIQNIYYSHCNNITLNGAEINFYHFNECDFENLQLKNKSRIYGCLFRDGNIWGLHSKDSFIVNTVFANCSINRLQLENTTWEENTYIPDLSDEYSGISSVYKTISKNYRTFRLTYSRQGDRVLTKESYYLERKFEMLSSFSSLSSFSAKNWNWRTFIRNIFKTIKESFQTMIKLFQSLIMLFDYTLWGFGERPLRLLLSSLLFIVAYASVYNVIGLKPSYIESLSFSLFSFIRVATDGFSSFSIGEKLLVGSEALSGWVMIVLVINAFVSKTKF